ncbi:DUF6612 family protein [Paenisporosarcina indica]|uniref:DUF6612 family protein n=1 Tax=Paenisporosarcina indica TaxID=650093 RepID=UPI00095010BD|nr:DUF6612 family protein [Paenisporosarcina indica]
MKKWMTIMAASLLTFSLAACNSTATPTSETAEENTSKLTLEQVFEKSLSQSETIESLSATLEMSQLIEMPSQAVSMNTTSDLTMDMVVEPLSIYQKGTTTMAVPGDASTTEPQDIEIESYMTEDGFFMYENMTKQWMKLPPEMYNQMMAMSESQADPAQQLKDLQPFMKDFTFEQTDTEYVLKLAASGEQFNELIQKQLTEMMPEAMVEEEELLKGLSIEKVNYEIFIDKETFNTTALNMIMDMTMAVEGEEMKLSQDLKSIFSNYNKVEPIKVPQEVLDSAQEM